MSTTQIASDLMADMANASSGAKPFPSEEAAKTNGRNRVEGLEKAVLLGVTVDTESEFGFYDPSSNGRGTVPGYKVTISLDFLPEGGDRSYAWSTSGNTYTFPYSKDGLNLNEKAIENAYNAMLRRAAEFKTFLELYGIESTGNFIEDIGLLEAVLSEEVDDPRTIVVECTVKDKKDGSWRDRFVRAISIADD